MSPCAFGPMPDASFGHRSLGFSFVWRDYHGNCYLSIELWRWSWVLVLRSAPPRQGPSEETLRLIAEHDEMMATAEAAGKLYTMDEILGEAE